MGEHADDALICAIDELCDDRERDDYSGYGYLLPRHRGRCTGRIECKRCGKDGLQWLQEDEGWRLYDLKGKLHTCDPARANKGLADAFTVTAPPDDGSDLV